VSKATDALKEGAEYTQHVVSAPPTSGTLFVKTATNREPDWVRLLGPVSQPPVSDYGRATGALLVLKSAGRWFGLAFGMGYHLLEPKAYERGFGRRVALNAVDPAQLRGAQARTFNDYALHTSLQVSRLSDVTAFELDFQRDLLTSVAGTVADSNLGQRVDGTHSVRLTSKLEVDDLSAKCKALLKASEGDAYRTAFPKVDTIREVQDPEAVTALDEQMFKAFSKKQYGDFDLFPPELVSDEIVRYRLHPKEGGLVVVEPDSSLLEYARRSRYGADPERALDRYKLIGCNSSDEEVDRWSFRECLRYEAADDGAMAVLDGGVWYRVERSLVDDVEAFAHDLEASDVDLPAAERDQKEGDYNDGAAVGDAFALLDKKLVGIGGGQVEPCDLLSNQRHLIHVKRRKGGSAPLGHLFNQAIVSAESLLDGPDFSQQICEKLESAPPEFASQFSGDFDPREWSIVLALITKEQTAGHPARRLPFFSKVTLRLAVQHLRRMGFTVYVDEIPTPL
jgi:uncharacterized protein (TIGR04141 family)